MPFGKYRGWPVGELPSDYLEWLFGNVALRGRLFDAVNDELLSRERKRTTRSQPAPSVAIQLRSDQVPIAREVFNLGYRTAAKAAHPDLGGSAEKMRQLNALAESVRSQLGALEAAI